MVSRGIHNVQLMDLAANTVQFPVKVLNGGRVRVLEFAAQEPRHQRRLPHTCRPAGDRG